MCRLTPLQVEKSEKMISEIVEHLHTQFLSVNYGICMMPVISFFTCTVVPAQSCQVACFLSNEVNLN